MRKVLVLIVMSVVLIGCSGNYRYFTDANGREHCQDLNTGKFVDDVNCGKK